MFIIHPDCDQDWEKRRCQDVKQKYFVVIVFFWTAQFNLDVASLKMSINCFIRVETVFASPTTWAATAEWASDGADLHSIKLQCHFHRKQTWLVAAETLERLREVEWIWRRSFDLLFRSDSGIVGQGGSAPASLKVALEEEGGGGGGGGDVSSPFRRFQFVWGAARCSVTAASLQRHCSVTAASCVSHWDSGGTFTTATQFGRHPVWWLGWLAFSDRRTGYVLQIWTHVAVCLVTWKDFDGKWKNGIISLQFKVIWSKWIWFGPIDSDSL